MNKFYDVRITEYATRLAEVEGKRQDDLTLKQLMAIPRKDWGWLEWRQHGWQDDGEFVVVKRHGLWAMWDARKQRRKIESIVDAEDIRVEA